MPSSSKEKVATKWLLKGSFKTFYAAGLISWLISPIAALPFGCGLTDLDSNSANEVTEWHACSITEKFVSDRLKAPTTATFPRGNCSAAKTDKSWTVRGYVDSQNSFGAMLRGKYFATVRTTEWKNGRWYWELDSINIE